MSTNIPSTENELLNRAWDLSGKTLKQAAKEISWPLPKNLLTNKGWIGQLIEYHLGTTTNNRAEPDFPHLGIELKTIPISPSGIPQETTYICTINLQQLSKTNWQNSFVKQKLSKVLWVPIISEKNHPLSERIIGAPLLWQPTQKEEATLRQDWNELVERVIHGEIHEISGRLGQALHIRPKGANAKELQNIIGAEGQTNETMRRGFYLRTQFTTQILQRHYAIDKSD